MYHSIISGAFHGMNSYLINVEVDVSDGLPCMDMVGYLAGEVKETRERVRVGIKNSGYRIPAKRITISLSPADIRKDGSAFDLPVAIGILGAMGELSVTDQFKRDPVIILGEMGLNGEVKTVKGVFPILLAAVENGLHNCIVPAGNVAEAIAVENMHVYGVENLKNAVSILGGEKHEINDYVCEKVIAENTYKTVKDKLLDFSQVFGQETAKRAAEIAAAGFHNLLLFGPPGSGKSMIAERIPTIMPRLTMQESIEVTKIGSMAGCLQANAGMIRIRPFLQPHHTVSVAALVGGGNTPNPGIVTLAHKGILFLDELPEFGRKKLDLLRQPIEDAKVQIARNHYNCTYPADFLLVCAMNVTTIYMTQENMHPQSLGRLSQEKSNVTTIYMTQENMHPQSLGRLSQEKSNVTTIYMTQENMHPQSLGRLSQEKSNVTTIYMTQENMHPQSLGRLSQEKSNKRCFNLIQG